MDLLTGKVAIITGASKGIGRVMSRLFAREGAAAVCTARSGGLVEETAALVAKDGRRAASGGVVGQAAARVTKGGGRAIAVTGDAAKEMDVRRIIAEGVKAFGKIDT